jgi:hypothetical protein
VTIVTAAIVVIGIALSLSVGVARGFDTASVALLALLAAVGALAVAVARKSSTGETGPDSCLSCGGLISPSAPYCKHCGRSTGR